MDHSFLMITEVNGSWFSLQYNFKKFVSSACLLRSTCKLLPCSINIHRFLSNATMNRVLYLLKVEGDIRQRAVKPNREWF